MTLSSVMVGSRCSRAKYACAHARSASSILNPRRAPHACNSSDVNEINPLIVSTSALLAFALQLDVSPLDVSSSAAPAFAPCPADVRSHGALTSLISWHSTGLIRWCLMRASCSFDISPDKQ
ncbi:Uncharacterised protein [Chlamydia trachomatis]|nr:Uncharacterised protein [Chlamydia trachomatis]